ncbi:Eco57I restriction-modification methylase domain-containing protein [Flagellimonas meishanensis]|uniref:Eco57I restriction-modification methylase domain-containing protein n=1 Tax=Flagellimonas meishanensis TaxID=2873264 RepID=UPI001CA66034|nr:Eco57I restriction-modification methylase domain-containing protein [[Muricauda] meishanensis]
MDRNSAINLIDKTFNSAFDEAQFTNFIQNLLNDFEIKPYKASGNTIWEDQRDHVSYYKRIGKYIDPEGEPLDVLIVQVKNVSKLERARTALRNFVIKHLNNFEKDYALVAFYSKEDDGYDWRFSFIKMEYQSYLDEEKQKVKMRKEFTPAKRYSFLVGKYEKSYTAKAQLLPLLQNISNNPTISELKKAFSIERVTDEFFEQYKSLYIKVYEYFENENLPIFHDGQIDASGFTKKLLGQIVFLYFLQKKGWLGVPKNERWGAGDKHFVQKLFVKAQENGQNFYNGYLQYLFYEALAKERDNNNSFYPRFNCRIPFLNGGLFEAPYDWENISFSIPMGLFRNDEKNKSGDVGTGILDVFDRYNFTIKEDEPLDKEVAVDPEMLGKVFENMLEIKERKSKGAFYTPREIVHYMCQESLIHYLDNVLNKDDIARVPKDDIEQYIREGHLALENDVRVAERGETRTYKYLLPESVRRNADVIDAKLTEIRICDPAIGSGAFPVGLLHELVTAHLVLKPHLSYSYLDHKLIEFDFHERESINESRYVYRLKKHIIQKSIYGVDIDRSAIDIARLRLWLSLVVDEDDLEPIETLPNLDYKIVCGNSIIGLPEQGADRYPTLKDELEELKKQFYNETNEEEKRFLRSRINEKIHTVLQTAEDFEGYSIDFDYQLFFSEVWKEKGGFDIVIGNPPYVQIQKFDKETKEIFKKLKFETLSSTGDLYELFYEKGNNILRLGGHLCYITSNKWLRANYGTSTRKYFLTETNPKLLLDFGQRMVFSTAIVHSNILLFEKNRFKNEFRGCQFENSSLESLASYFSENFIHLDYLNEDVWSISNPRLIRIKSRLTSIGTKLSDWKINFRRGILTGFNSAFIIDEETKENLVLTDSKSKEILHPILRGRDTRKYYCNYKNLYVIGTFPTVNIDINEYPSIKNYLLSFDRRKLEQNGITYIDDNGDKVKSRKKTKHQWFELQDSTSYWTEFAKDKIIFSEIVSEPQFYYDTKEFYPEASAFLITGQNLKWLIAFLNSEPITTIFRLFFAGGELVGKYRYKKAFLANLPIPLPRQEYLFAVELLVHYLTFYKGLYKDKSKESAISNYYELLIDALVYEILFAEEFQLASKTILNHLVDLKPINDKMSDEEKLSIIQNEYQRLYHPDHPIRYAIETIESIEEVRIIKEAKKQ